MQLLFDYLLAWFCKQAYFSTFHSALPANFRYEKTMSQRYNRQAVNVYMGDFLKIYCIIYPLYSFIQLDNGLL